jgi:SpoVK/Ycf46/Vps4 family AAA+-type ATPase
METEYQREIRKLMEYPENSIQQNPKIDGEQEYNNGNTQWTVVGDSFYPHTQTKSLLPKGYYEMDLNHSTGQYYFKKKKVLIEDILVLPDDKFKSIIDDIKVFWTAKSKYQEYKFNYKRGILLYGVPGGGKTSLINLLAQELIEEHNGIVWTISKPDHIYDFFALATPFKEIEPNRKFILIIEDIDNFTSNRDLTSALLQILDGNDKIDNVVVIATTNYPELLEERISSRPSRFDRRYEITTPDEKVREFFIKNKVNKKFFKKIPLKTWVESTDGFTIDHIKELILSHCILDLDFNESLETLNDMITNSTLKSIDKIGKSENRLGFR